MEKNYFDNKSQYEVPQSETIVLSQESFICTSGEQAGEGGGFGG